MSIPSSTELAISLEELAVQTLLDDAPLVDYFASRGRFLEEALFHPMRALDDTDSADILGPDTAKPFAIMQMNAEQGIFPIYSGFTLELFDEADNRYNELRKMVQLVRDALDHKFMASTASGYTQWFRVDAITNSPPQTDPEYLCDTMFVRFQVYGA
jgi:hypothetical protein